MKTKGAIIILSIVALSFLFMVPATSTDAAIDPTDVNCAPIESTTIKVSAGSSDVLVLVITNHLPYLSNDLTNDRVVTFDISAPDNVKITTDESYISLKGNEMTTVNLKIDVGNYVHAGTYNVSIVLNLFSPLTDERISTAPMMVGLTITSSLSSEDSYNEILGIFENPLPEPFNTPAFTALITFVLWILIGVIAFILIVPLVLRIFMRSYEEERKQLTIELRKFLPMVLILFAIGSSLRVYGAPEEIIGTVDNWFNILYVILGAVISWRFYLVFVKHTSDKISSTKKLGQRDMDIGPLLRLLGKLAISVLSVGLILSILGFDLTTIIASAGVVSLGITLGAQSILSQFFSGMVLLITRPFKSGDLVQIGTNSTVYRVTDVNIMNTTFENSDNDEIIIIPNNTVSSSIIVNMTGGGPMYKIEVFITVAYGEDLELSKSLMVKPAIEHPGIVMDGSVDRPYARVMGFEDSCIKLRLTAYVKNFDNRGSISGQLREEMYKLFQENNINIPFPQMDVHLDATDSTEDNENNPKKKKTDT